MITMQLRLAKDHQASLRAAARKQHQAPARTGIKARLAAAASIAMGAFDGSPVASGSVVPATH